MPRLPFYPKLEKISFWITIDPNADLLLVGEAPELEEDEKGLSFVGRCKTHLDKILLAIGLNRYDEFSS